MAEQTDFPGHDLISRGMADLGQGHETAEALLVAIGAPRLRKGGMDLPPAESLPKNPELMLYRLLCLQEGRGAYSSYQSLIRRLVSFERAMEQQIGAEIRKARARG